METSTRESSTKESKAGTVSKCPPTISSMRVTGRRDSTRAKENWCIHLVSILKEAFWRVNSAARACKCGLMDRGTSGNSLMGLEVAVAIASSTMGHLMRDNGRTTNAMARVF